MKKAIETRMFINKFICVILVFILAIVGSVGCSDPRSEENGSEDNAELLPESDTGTIPPEGHTVIASNAETEYMIVVASDYYRDANIKDKVSEISSYIKKKTGVRLEVTTDRLLKNEEDRAKPAILIGPTNFAESTASDDLMRLGDYYIEYKGNKIVIYSEYAEGALDSLTYFKSMLTRQSENDKALYFDKSFQKKVSGKYMLKSILCNGIQLGNYSIVIPKNATVNEEQFAYRLRYYLRVNYGCVIPVKNDSTEASENEIIVGAARQYALDIAANHYSIALNDGNLYFYANDLAGYLGMYSYVESNLFSTAKREYVLDNGYSYSALASGSLTDGTQLLTQRSGDVRVMMYNCFGYNDGTNGSMELRQPIQNEIVAGYAPDVIGFQEFTSFCYKNFAPMLEQLGYTWLETSAGRSDYTPIFYRADKVTPIECGYKLYSGANNSNSKSATWCVFENNETQKLFGVVSTHFMYSPNYLTAEEAQATRKSNATEMVAVIDAILDKYSDLPLVGGGDMNCRIGKEETHTVLSESGLVHAYDIADVKNEIRSHGYSAVYDEAHHTYTALPMVEMRYLSSIDHAYATKHTSIATFCTLADPYCLATSDHMPLLLDIKLK